MKIDVFSFSLFLNERILVEYDKDIIRLLYSFLPRAHFKTGVEYTVRIFPMSTLSLHSYISDNIGDIAFAILNIRSIF